VPGINARAHARESAVAIPMISLAFLTAWGQSGASGLATELLIAAMGPQSAQAKSSAADAERNAIPPQPNLCGSIR
jgi:hypothetical protein